MALRNPQAAFVPPASAPDPVTAPGTDVLPPPGHARREVLAQRQDKLEESAEQKAAADHAERIDPSQIEVDEEIMRLLAMGSGTDGLAIDKPQPGRHYCWASMRHNGLSIQAKVALGYRAVSGTDPECEMYRQADGTRVIADAILMWIPEARYRAIKFAQAKRAALIDGASERDVRELADKHGVRIYRHDEMPERLVEATGKRLLALDVAARKRDTMLREGSMPGVPAGRR